METKTLRKYVVHSKIILTIHSQILMSNTILNIYQLQRMHKRVIGGNITRKVY